MTTHGAKTARPSKAEAAKLNSRLLRGRVAEQLAEGGDRFGGEDVTVMKFHGIYQQEDRDVRIAARRSGGSKHYEFMIRSKVPGGVLEWQQYLAHDALADEHANGTLRITTRQDFQLHGALKSDLRTIIRAVNEAHVTTLGACGDITRNVMCCPAPGSEAVRADVGRIAAELSARLLPRTGGYQEVWLDGEKVVSLGEDEDEPLYGPTYLPRKFKIAFALPGDNCVDVYSQDLGFVPIARDDVLEGFTILVGGGMGMTHGMERTYPRVATPLGTVVPHLLLSAAEAIVAVQRDYGNRVDRRRARLKYLLDERGVDWFRAEVEQRLGWRLGDPVPAASWEVDDHLGWRSQGDGRWSLGVYVENGRVQDRDGLRLRTALRAIVERFHPGIRLTGQQNVLLTDLAADDRATIDRLLEAHGVRAAETLSPTFRAAMACPALPTCGQAVAEAERALPPVIRGIESELDRLGLGQERISVRMTGCPNGCARPYLGDVGIVGRSAGLYQVYLAGDFVGTRLNRLYADLVAQDEIVRTLSPVFRAFRDERIRGEGFGDYCNRVGVVELGRRFLREPVRLVELPVIEADAATG